MTIVFPVNVESRWFRRKTTVYGPVAFTVARFALPSLEPGSVWLRWTLSTTAPALNDVPSLNLIPCVS
jgi:hypothetical protein